MRHAARSEWALNIRSSHPTDVLAVACVAVAECDDELDGFDAAADASEEALSATPDVVALSLVRFLRGMSQA